MTIVAIFGEPILQGFHLLGQTTVLLTQLLNQDVLLPEQRLLLLDQFITLRQLFSQGDQFFFDRHALTLLALMSLDKSQADLRSYEDTYKLCYIRGPEGIILELAEPVK